MKELKASTKAGQNIISRAKNYEGYFLSEVYSSWSAEKQRAWDWCEHQYYTSDQAEGFHICSHNSFSFSVAWKCVYNEENVLRLETSNNSYIVYLDR